LCSEGLSLPLSRMVINSPTSLLLFQFEDVRWVYTLDAEMLTERWWRRKTSPVGLGAEHCFTFGECHAATPATGIGWLWRHKTLTCSCCPGGSAAGHREAVEHLEVLRTAPAIGWHFLK